MLAAVLLSPRPSALLVLNEPEAGLRACVIPTLASLVRVASERTQNLVVYHNMALMETHGETDGRARVHHEFGDTDANRRLRGVELPGMVLGQTQGW